MPCQLISELTIVRALQPVNASSNWKLPTVPEMEPLKKQRSLFYTRLCQKGEKWPSQFWPRLFYSQPNQLPCAHHPLLKHAHLPLSHLFLLAQNISSKQIVPTDNMRPKLHDKYTRHQWLKGFNWPYLGTPQLHSFCECDTKFKKCFQSQNHATMRGTLPR